MRYLEDLQVRLRDRFRRLVTAPSGAYSHEVRLILDWIAKQRPLMSVIAAAEAAAPVGDADFDEWLEACSNARSLTWPHNFGEEGRAVLVWKLLAKLAEDPQAPWRIGYMLTGESNVDAATRALTESAIRPLFDYLGEEVGAESSVLYHLERFVKRLEWFDREPLHVEFLANTKQGEVVYDRYLRKFLFDQGLDMPLTQAASASGESDVLSELGSSDPLVCEVKVFDNLNRDKRHLASGVNQAVQYAHDYGKRVSYLVLINLSERVLQLPTDGIDEVWPPFVEVGGVRVYLVAVRALRTASASKQGKPTPITFARADLVSAAPPEGA